MAVGHEEAVQVEVELLLHRRAVNLRDEPLAVAILGPTEADPRAGGVTTTSSSR